MKRIILLVISCCFIYTQTFAFMLMTNQVVVVAGGGCSATPTETCGLAGDATGYQVGDTVDLLATKFTASASGTICQVVNSMLNSGGLSVEDVAIEIWSDNSDQPGSIIGTSSDLVAFGSIGSSYADITFSNINATGITSATSYWIVMNPEGTVTNVYNWERLGSGCSPEHIMTTTDNGTSWDEVTSIRSLTYEVHYTE